MPGSTAHNIHEGYRSEYLAQFAFSSFGTCTSIPGAEDTGLDLLCTMTERLGKHAWARQHYFVQVKSTMEPWRFESENEVRWLIDHPSPIFLCVVSKAEARLRVYQTTARFYIWAMAPTPTLLDLVPTTDQRGNAVSWTPGIPCSLGAPILDFTVQELGDVEFREALRATLASWIDVESTNLRRRRQGTRWFSMPNSYRPNIPVIDPPIAISGGTRSVPPEQTAAAAAEIRDTLAWLTDQLAYGGDLVSAACGILFLYRTGGIPMDPSVTEALMKLNAALGMPSTFGMDCIAPLEELLAQRLTPATKCPYGDGGDPMNPLDPATP
jgi:hypothetical protein